MNIKEHLLRGCGVAAICVAGIGGAQAGVTTGTLVMQVTVLQTCRIDTSAGQAPRLNCTAGNSHALQTATSKTAPGKDVSILTVTY